jgi:hypothetical protein
VSTKVAVFWVVAPCSLVEVYQRFRGPCCLHPPTSTRLHTLTMEAARTSKTLANFCQTTRRYNPEDSHLLFLRLSVAIAAIRCCTMTMRVVHSSIVSLPAMSPLRVNQSPDITGLPDRYQTCYLFPFSATTIWK